jgi:hypothetical protein
MKTPSADPYGPVLGATIDAAVTRTCGLIRCSMPLSGAQVLAWMRQLAGGDEPAAYYHHVAGSPMFLFPWYLEQTLRAEPDRALQSDLVYSTVNGYYWVRLIDNLTDSQATNELELLPALGLFHTEFQRVYHRHFRASHRFWALFTEIWFHSADVTMQDLHRAQLDRDAFTRVAAQKICAIKIPLAALCYKYSRPDLIAAWGSLVDLFGCWHQMSNDLFHWYEDFSTGTPSYFLAEAQRRRRTDESIPDWVTREGFAWGLDSVDKWMQDLRSFAKQLRSRQLTRYLKFRDVLLHREAADSLESLRLASGLKGLFY